MKCTRFDNGDKIDSYQDDRSLESLVNYCREKAESLYTEPQENVVLDEDIEIDLSKSDNDNKVLPNPTGKVVTLTGSNFDKLIGSGIWFIKFFAPWCVHCQKLAPAWEELGRSLKNKVNVGSVDCTVEGGK